MENKAFNNYRIGLACGSGSARGWSHIGIIKALTAIGIEPHVVCGCSIGSLVAASYASGNLSQLEHWVRSLTKLEVARFLELNVSLNGFVNLERLHTFLTHYVYDESTTIETLGKTFAAVSTDLETGREIWFTKGPVIEAVWASIALPGLFPPIEYQGRWLVDGGLVNPVPVSICRALNADFVIAINLNSGMLGRHTSQKPAVVQNSKYNMLAKTIKEYSATWFPAMQSKSNKPSLYDAIAGSVYITQDRITRSRMAGDPPDIVLTPKLSHIGLLEFYRAAETIKEGEECVTRMLPEIHYALGTR